MGIFETKGYHGTDSKVVNNILNNGFTCKTSKEHWLGDGIYLYEDKKLAEWWTTNPTEKHGIIIEKPAIIECYIEVEEDKVLNLCTLEGYERYVRKYNSFFNDWAYRAKPQEKVNFKQLRCAFFNLILLSSDIDLVIAPFILPDQPYMPRYFNDIYANNMHILYPEIQLCIAESRQEIIKKKIIQIL